jgi:hypothetical protein
MRPLRPRAPTSRLPITACARASALALLAPLTLACAARVPVAPPAPAPPSPVVVAPEWRLFDVTHWTPTARLRLGDEVLLAGAGGERWIHRASGSWVAASTMLPDDVTGVLRRPDGYLFVGASGVTMRTRDALGPVVEVRAPSIPIARAAGGARAIVALTPSGDVARSVDAGVTWTKRAIDFGPRSNVALAMSDDGEGLLVAYPQLVFTSRDDGDSWQLDFDGGGFGQRAMRALHLGETGAPISGGSGCDRPRAFGCDPPEPPMPRRPLDATWASIVLPGHLALAGDRWVLLAREGVDEWRVGSGPFGVVPELRDESRLRGCRDVVVGALGDEVAIACLMRWHEGDRSDSIVLESHDGGRSYVTTSLEADGAPADVHLGPGGLIGIRSYGREYLRARTGEPFRLREQAWETVADNPRRGLVGLVERDGAFHLRALPDGRVGLAIVPWHSSVLDVDDGAITVAAYEQGGARILRSWDHGDSLTEIGRVDVADRIELHGAYGVATAQVASYPMEQTRETTDGGQTWRAIASPAGRVLGCNRLGCVFERGVRLGFGDPPWRGAPASPPLPPPAPDVRPPTACRAKGTWTPRKLWLPTARDVAPGVRSVVLEPGADDASTVLVTRAGVSKPVERHALFGPLPEAKRATTTTDVSYGEGGVWGYRRDANGIELAWFDPWLGKVRRARSATIDKAPGSEGAITAEGLLVWFHDLSGEAWWVDVSGAISTFRQPRGQTRESDPSAIPVRFQRQIWFADLYRGGPLGGAPTPGPELHVTPPMEIVNFPRLFAIGDGSSAFAKVGLSLVRTPAPMFVLDAPALDGGRTFLLPLHDAYELRRLPLLRAPRLGLIPACDDAPRGLRLEREDKGPTLTASIDGDVKSFRSRRAVVFVDDLDRVCFSGLDASVWGPLGSEDYFVSIDARAPSAGLVFRLRDQKIDERPLDCTPPPG